MGRMRAAQFTKINGPLELVEREIPEPQRGMVRIKVQACGVCHSDSFTQAGAFPGMTFPRIPGHEVAGVIESLGPDVTTWKVGQRVGVGWTGKYCGHCDSCRRGSFTTCENLLISGVSFDGGYAEYMVAPVEALALIPDDLSAVEAAPLLCAGVTTFNSLRNSGARAGDLVAILGVGGLGHLGIQFAVKMGFKTVAIARGRDKEELAYQLGAKYYINSEKQDPAEELKRLGGARIIVATAANSKAMSATAGGLTANGKLLIIGVTNEPLEISPLFLILGCRSIVGWASGASIDSQDTLAFSALTGVRSINEVFSLEHAADAYAHMMSGKARFRAVINMEA